MPLCDCEWCGVVIWGVNLNRSCNIRIVSERNADPPSDTKYLDVADKVWCAIQFMSPRAAVNASARAVGNNNNSLVKQSLSTNNHLKPSFDSVMYKKSADNTSPGAFGMILCRRGRGTLLPSLCNMHEIHPPTKFFTSACKIDKIDGKWWLPTEKMRGFWKKCMVFSKKDTLCAF